MSDARPRIEAWFLRQWQTVGPAQVVLRPLSWLFGALTALRRCLFRLAVLPRIQVARPVLVVGNITVGGTGKTPLVIAIVERLRLAGIRVGVVTRGYRKDGESAQPELIHIVPGVPHTGQLADEAMLLARRTGVPVVASADRIAACEKLIALDPTVQLIVCDDGMQHYRLHRDFEICVIDGARGFGNGALLPAGPLREPPSRLSNVGAIVVNRTLSNLGGARLAEQHSNAPMFAMTYGDESLMSLGGEKMTVSEALDCWAGRKICAIAGIGHPHRFFSHLGRLGFKCSSQEGLPDHHPFLPADINSRDADLVLVTEKDAVKLALFTDELNKPVWALRISAHLPTGFDDFLLARAHALIAPYVHRSQTA